VSVAAAPRIGFILERSLGHLTHAETLARLIPEQPDVRPEVRQIDFGAEGWPAKVPLFNSNWTVRSGVRARRIVRELRRGGPLDGLFVHTQVPAVLMPDRLHRIPTVVSLDATPLQYDELGAAYEHQVGNERVEHLKWRANRSCFERAAHVVTWTTWAKQGVIDGYGIAGDKITVIPPGVTPSLWRPQGPRVGGGDALHILFVGGDLERKGGDELIEAVVRLQAEHAETSPGDPPVLDLVTRAEVPARPGIRVHRGLTPNSPELVALFHQADIFALPTKADCLGLALLEGGAAGLPLVSTSVAGVAEIVRDGESGLVVPPDDVNALVHALRTLIHDPTLRRRLGDGAAALVADRFDASTNTEKLVQLVVEQAQQARQPS
jgi:glycosyltransferase involved in cell wall biosynthesis